MENYYMTIILSVIIVILILYILISKFKIKKAISYIKEISDGNIIISKPNKSDSILIKKAKTMLSKLLDNTELVENHLQKKNIIMYLYTRFFLNLPTLYKINEIIEHTLEFSTKIFQVDVVCFIIFKQNEDQAYIFQNTNKNFATNFSRTVEQIDKANINNKNLIKNYILPEERNILFTEDICTAQNLMQIPITVNNKLFGIIQIINKRNKKDFDSYDEELASTMSLGISNQIQIIEKIDEEKGISTQLSSIINSITDGILITDNKKDIVLENPAARDLFSLNPIKKELLINELLKPPVNPNINMVLFKPERLVLLGKISEILNSYGEVDKYIISLRNITEAKQKEREQSEILFLTATKMFRPLLKIKKTKELFRFSPDDEIENQLSSNLNLVFNLLNKLIYYAEIEAGPMRLAKKPADINYLIEKVIDSLGNLFSNNKMEIITKLDTSIEKIMLDAERIEQSISNIFSFLVKVAQNEKKFKKLIVSSYITNEHNAVVEIQHPNYIFNHIELMELTKKRAQLDKFMQSDQELEDLNLEFAFVHHITKSHGGNLTISSQQDIGTIYRLILPLEK